MLGPTKNCKDSFTEYISTRNVLCSSSTPVLEGLEEGELGPPPQAIIIKAEKGIKALIDLKLPCTLKLLSINASSKK
jgi:hypothetical protein